MLQLLSFLSNVLEVVGVILVVAVVFFIVRTSLRRLGSGGAWQAYTRPVNGRGGQQSVEVGVKRTRFLGLGAPDRMPIDTLTSRLVSEDPGNLYSLQSKASETAASLNARRDQSDY